MWGAEAHWGVCCQTPPLQRPLWRSPSLLHQQVPEKEVNRRGHHGPSPQGCRIVDVVSEMAVQCQNTYLPTSILTPSSLVLKTPPIFGTLISRKVLSQS